MTKEENEKMGKTKKEKLTREKAKELLIQMFLKKWKKIGRTILDLALGKAKLRRRDGVYYTLKPDAKLLQWIVELVIEKKMDDSANSKEEIQELSALLREMVKEMKKRPASDVRRFEKITDEEIKKLLEA